MAQDGASRRRFLQLSAVALGGLAASGITGQSGGEEAAAGWIDAHAHIWTRDVARFPLKAGATVEDLDPPSFTAEELLAAAEPLGIRRVVLIAHHLYYGFDNTYLIDAARRYPGRFRVVGMVDDLQPAPDARMRRLLEQQVTAFRITPWVRNAADWLETAGMKAMWQCAAETGQAMCCLIDPAQLEQVGRMCASFPRTPVVIDHFARIGADGQIRESDVANLAGLARFPQTYVKVSAFYALGRKQPPYDDLLPMFRRIYEAFGPQRLMWASDAPYQLAGGHSYRASLELIQERAAFLDAEDRQWLLRGTAERVYFGGRAAG